MVLPVLGLDVVHPIGLVPKKSEREADIGDETAVDRAVKAMNVFEYEFYSAKLQRLHSNRTVNLWCNSFRQDAM